MDRLKKLILGFGIFLGFCTAILPLKTNAYNVILSTDTITVEIEDYLELSVISGTGGTNVSYSDGTYTGTLSNGSALANFGTTVLSAVTNNAAGWKLQARSSTNNGAGVATMVGSTTGLTIPSSSTSLDGSASTWTMRLTAGTGSPTIATGYNAAHTIPASNTTVATGSYGDPRQMSVTYGVGIASTQAADTYTGQVIYTLSVNGS